MSTPRVIAVVGPTAAGKSAAGLAIARAVGGEVINADAMQCYRGMDIGTAKLPFEQRQQVPHHLLDIWPVTWRASVADYQRRAVQLIEQLLSRQVTPVVVGGSGLYLRALLDQMAIPPTDPQVRAGLERELAEEGAPALHRRLDRLDPAAAAAILPSNGRRIVRALEVVQLTGSFSATLPEGRYRWPATVQVGMDSDRLDERIASRVQQMFAAGLHAEVQGLLAEGLAGGPTASKALGYAQVLAHPDDPERAAADTAQATRRYARRQRSWFRRDARIRWVTGEAAALGAVT